MKFTDIRRGDAKVLGKHTVGHGFTFSPALPSGLSGTGVAVELGVAVGLGVAGEASIAVGAGVAVLVAGARGAVLAGFPVSVAASLQAAKVRDAAKTRNSFLIMIFFSSD